MNRRIAILLSTPAFETFFGAEFGLTPQRYASTYRNDFSWYYADMFARHGIESHIYVPSLASGEFFSTPENISVRLLKLQTWYSVIAKLPIWRTAPGRYFSQILNTLAFLPALKKGLAADQVDILYIQEYWSGRFDLLSMVLAKDVFIIGSDHGGFRDKNLTFLKRIAFSRVAALTSQTLEEVKHVMRHGRTPALFANPLDTDYFAPNGSTRPSDVGKRILTVARLENTQKRVSDLIEAIAHLGKDWSLTIAGEGSDRGMLEQKSRDLGVSERVKFIGFVGDRSMLRSLYWKCDVFCLPSAFEGLPMVVLEAMSCGRPVVVTDIPAYRDLIEPGVDAIVVPARDPQALAAGIQLAQDQREALSAAGRTKILQAHSQRTFMQNFEREIIAHCSPSPRSTALSASEA